MRNTLAIPNGEYCIRFKCDASLHIAAKQRWR